VFVLENDVKTLAAVEECAAQMCVGLKHNISKSVNVMYLQNNKTLLQALLFMNIALEGA
jgi:hypothetical protein